MVRSTTALVQSIVNFDRSKTLIVNFDRSNRQHFVHFSLMKCNFPIDNKYSVVLSDGVYSTVLDMSVLFLV